MRYLILLLILISSHFVSGQNWKTVALNDTNYFSAGRQGFHFLVYQTVNVTYPIGPDSSLLRMMYVKNYSLAGFDTVYHFFSTFRDTAFIGYGPNPPCADTASGSWLGYSCIRNEGSAIEYYFNKYSDTIKILTKAGLGTSWTLAKDTGGKTFVGTVTHIGTQLIDGILDSVKTISIQAYNGTIPVNNLYNNLVLQLSKNNGWVKALDFFRFPNNTWGKGYGGIPVDSNQHIRLPKHVSNVDLIEEDMVWKYKPGNEWIVLKDQELFSGSSEVVNNTWYDSVMAYRQLSPTSAEVTFKSIHFDHYRTFGTPAGVQDRNSIVIWTHTDTINQKQGGFISRKVEVGALSALKDRYYISSYDTDRYFLTRADLVHPNFGFGTSPTCLVYPPLVSIGFETSRFETYLPGFGQTELYYYSTDQYTGRYTHWRVSYIRTGGHNWGTKINVAALAIEEAVVNAVPFKVYPNPANDHINVTSSTSLPSSLYLKNVTGQKVWQGGFSGIRCTIPTGFLPAGLYFLEIVTKESRQVIKVIVAH